MPIAVLHAHQGDAFGTEAVKNLSVDVMPFSTFHININVRKRGPAAGEEALEDEVMADRVNLADIDQVIDQA